MWLTGLVALAQMTVLPGALLVRAFGLRRLNAAEWMAYVFALSLITNAVLVPTLVAARMYIAPVMWALIIGEGWLLFKTRDREGQGWSVDFARFNALRELRFTAALGGLLLLSAALIYAGLFVKNWGSVFNANDDVANWDRWAREWAAGEFPTITSLYPQLMPANWSLTYVLLGTTEVKLFAKGTTVVYGLLTTLLFLSLALRRKAAAHLFGGFVFATLTFYYLGFEFLKWGYADLPLAFFGFLTFYSGYVLSSSTSDTPARTGILLTLIFSLGALLTKQGGIYVVVAAALWAMWRFRRATNEGSLLRRDAAVITLAIVAAAAVAWYGVKFAQIWLGHDLSNIYHLTQGLHEGRSYGQRLVRAATLFWNWHGETGHVVTGTIAALLLGGLFFRESRRVALWFLLPFLLLYAWFFSYELRVSAPAFPLMGFVCGFAAERVARLGSFLDEHRIAGCRAGVVAVLALAVLAGMSSYVGIRPRGDAAELFQWFSYSAMAVVVTAILWLGGVRLESRRLDLRIAVAAALVLLAGGGALLNPRDRMLAKQRDLARMIGDPVVNEKLYKAVREHGIRAAIVTDYWMLRDLPDINHLFRPIVCNFPCTVEGLRSAVAQYPDAGYILIEDWRVAPEARRELPESSEFSTIFVQGARMFMKVNATGERLADGPEFVSVTPRSGAGREAVFRFTFTDAQGSTDILSVVALVNTRADRTHACCVEWVRATNRVRLAADSGVGWAGESTPGTRGTLRNSQCEVDVRGARVAESGSRLELTLPMHFFAAFAGEKRIFGTATDSVGAAGQRERGLWVVP